MRSMSEVSPESPPPPDPPPTASQRRLLSPESVDQSLLAARMSGMPSPLMSPMLSDVYLSRENIATAFASG